MKKVLMFAFAAAILAASIGVANAQQRDVISIVGSSTVYPFATVVAERFGKAGSFKTPKIESTGTGGGFKLFCGGVGVQHPDIVECLAGDQGLRVRDLPEKRREGDRRGQDRLRRHRSGQFQERRRH